MKFAEGQCARPHGAGGEGVAALGQRPAEDAGAVNSRTRASIIIMQMRCKAEKRILNVFSALVPAPPAFDVPLGVVGVIPGQRHGLPFEPLKEAKAPNIQIGLGGGGGSRFFLKRNPGGGMAQNIVERFLKAGWPIFLFDAGGKLGQVVRAIQAGIVSQSRRRT